MYTTMFEYIKQYYTYICNAINSHIEKMYSVNQTALESENLHYCIMSNDNSYPIMEQSTMSKQKIQIDDSLRDNQKKQWYSKTYK